MAGAPDSVTIAVLIAYAIGASAGLLASKSEGLAATWRIFIRAQILLASLVISFLAAWRLHAVSDLIWPIVVSVAMVIVMIAAWFLTPPGHDRPGRAVLRGWAANGNTGFWVIPVATAVAGAAGAVISVLVDRMIVVVFAFATWVLRKYAPIPQRARTSWIDQAPLLALAIGLMFNYFSDPPDWTATVLEWVAPVMAATGAAIFVGSALHPTQRIPWRPGMRVWLTLVALRIVILVPIAVIAPTAPIAVTLLLCALSIPAFMPPQLSVLYGYADPVVSAGSRWGWVFAPIGLAAAEIVVRL